ncbi:MAG: hypothetical protein IJK63_08130 [Oscillospiraceae bacterium]|nr:hypothetical protein [Oscillospiraceae bacterium]
MLIHDDWFMRQIELIVTALARLLLGKELTSSPSAGEEAARESGELLLTLSAEGKICEAENLLFERAAPGDSFWLAAGLRFYQRLSEFPEETLHQNGFSREEILLGLKDLCEQCGHPEALALINLEYLG